MQHLYVAECSEGYAGTFLSIQEVKESLVDRFPLTSFLIHQFDAADAPTDTVWLLFYQHTNAVAYASNDKAAALIRQRMLIKLNHIHDEDIEYGRRVVGQADDAVATRLTTYSESDIQAGLAALDMLLLQPVVITDFISDAPKNILVYDDTK